MEKEIKRKRKRAYLLDICEQALGVKIHVTRLKDLADKIETKMLTELPCEQTGGGV